MNNAIDYAISKVCTQIPRQILTKAFSEHDHFSPNQTVSPEFLVRRKVIEEIVIPDLNVFGGHGVNLRISDLPKRPVATGYLIEIPLEMTQGSHLTSISTIGTDNGGLATGKSIEGMANAIMNSNNGYESGFTGDVQIVGPNVILVQSNVLNHSMRGTIGYDNRLSSLDKHYWNDFSRLVVLATQSLIYNNYILELGSLNASGTTPNQYLVSLIEGYESAREDYQTMLDEEMTKILILADPLSRSDMINWMVGRNY